MTVNSPDTDQQGRVLGTTAQPGDVVTSRWPHSGVRWRVIAIADGWRSTSPKHLTLQSLLSGRTSTRSVTDVVIVERVPKTTAQHQRTPQTPKENP